MEELPDTSTNPTTEGLEKARQVVPDIAGRDMLPPASADDTVQRHNESMTNPALARLPFDLRRVDL